jgi:hypothetical protein
LRRVGRAIALILGVGGAVIALRFSPASERWGTAAGGGVVARCLLLTDPDTRRRAVYVGESDRVRFERNTIEGRVYTSGNRDIRLDASNLDVSRGADRLVVSTYRGLYWLRRRPRRPVGAYEFSEALTLKHAMGRWGSIGMMYSRNGEPFEPLFPGDLAAGDHRQP